MLERANSKKSINLLAWLDKPDFKEESAKWHADHLDHRRDLDTVEVVARSKSRSRRPSIVSVTKNALLGGVNKRLPGGPEPESAMPRKKAPEITVCAFPVMLDSRAKVRNPTDHYNHDVGQSPDQISPLNQMSSEDDSWDESRTKHHAPRKLHIKRQPESQPQPQPKIKHHTIPKQHQPEPSSNTCESHDEKTSVMEPTPAEIRAAKIAKTHKAISDTILKHLSNLYEILANSDAFIEDPRVESELEIIINLEGASSTRMPDFEEIRKKDDRDKKIKDSLTDMDIIIFYLRKYRIFLHQLDGDVVVDPNVLDTAKDVLKELYRHTAYFEGKKKAEEERKTAQKVKALVLKSRKEREVEQISKDHIEKQVPDTKSGSKDNDDHQVQSEVSDIETVHSHPPSHNSSKVPESSLKSGNTLDEIYKAYEAPTGKNTKEQQTGEGEDEESEDESEEDEEKEFFAERERTLQSTIHTLEKFTNGLGKHSRLLEVILYQIDCILRVTKGQVDDEWEVQKAKEDVQDGHADGLEETVLDQLKNYRVMLQVWAKVSTKDDTELLEKIADARKAIVSVRPELGEQDNSASDASSTMEEGRSIHDASDKGNESDQETAKEGHRLITGGISCSCGHICQLALKRPMTPESELSEGEREQREWYEDNQTILKNYALPIVGFLKLSIKDASAGKAVDPTILTYAKMIMDLHRGTMREIKVDDELDVLMGEARQDITGLSLKQQFINYYYLALDPEISLELDIDVVHVCIELLAAVSEGSSEDDKQERLDPDELCFDR